MTTELFYLLLLLLISGFFSGSEMAYVLSNKVKVEIKAKKRNISARSALFFSENPENFFSTILIGNNISNIAYASISAVMLTYLFQFSELEILFISTGLLVLVGELIPKYLAREAPNAFFMITAMPLRIFSVVFSPIVKLTSTVSKKLTKANSETSESLSNIMLRDELKLLIRESQEAGNVPDSDSVLIQKVLELSEQRVDEVMTPRTDIVGIEIHDTIDDAIEIFIESGYSKLPVYEENLDTIRGVAIAHDVFKQPKVLTEIIRPVIYVPETKRSIEMLNDFLRQGVSISVVVDEFGGTAGIVTMEDVLEELFGEIEDEYDTEENVSRKIKDDTYLISGKVEVDLINEKFDLEIPEGNYNTIAGFITEKIGYIPAQGENVLIGNFTIHIIRSSQTKIELIKLSVRDTYEIAQTKIL